MASLSPSRAGDNEALTSRLALMGLVWTTGWNILESHMPLLQEACWSRISCSFSLLDRMLMDWMFLEHSTLVRLFSKSSVKRRIASLPVSAGSFLGSRMHL